MKWPFKKTNPLKLRDPREDMLSIQALRPPNKKDNPDIPIGCIWDNTQDNEIWKKIGNIGPFEDQWKVYKPSKSPSENSNYFAGEYKRVCRERNFLEWELKRLAGESEFYGCWTHYNFMWSSAGGISPEKPCEVGKCDPWNPRINISSPRTKEYNDSFLT